MRVAFSPPEKPRSPVAALCFFLFIAAGWLLALVLTEHTGIATVDLAPFRRIEQGAGAEATPSVLYSLLVVLCYRVGIALVDPAAGVLVLALLQLFILACICARACFWLYRKGAPLWLVFILVVGFAALVPLAHAAVQPHSIALVVACLLSLIIALIDAAANNCERLRQAGPCGALLALLAVLLFLDLTMLAVVVPTLAALVLTPSRVKGRLALLSLAMLIPSLIVLVLVFPSLGWSGDPITFLRQSVAPAVDVSYLPPLVVTLVALAGVLLNRRLRFVLPFVPLLALGVLTPILEPSASWEHWLLFSAFALCLPFLILVPAIREYRETKETLRKRLLEARLAIPEEERSARSEMACAALLAELTRRVNPEDGSIGLYVARAGELSCDPLAVQLGALGYRIAYPVFVSHTEIDFLTTAGASDEDLLNALIEGNPLEMEPSKIAALVVPGCAFDRDRYRLGQGRGSYERYIPRLKASVPVWGVGFREQLVESLPVDDNDKPLDGVIVA